MNDQDLVNHFFLNSTEDSHDTTTSRGEDISLAEN